MIAKGYLENKVCSIIVIETFLLNSVVISCEMILVKNVRCDYDGDMRKACL